MANPNPQSKTVKVTLVRSLIGTMQSHRATVRGLGLRLGLGHRGGHLLLRGRHLLVHGVRGARLPVGGRREEAEDGESRCGRA